MLALSLCALGLTVAVRASDDAAGGKSATSAERVASQPFLASYSRPASTPFPDDNMYTPEREALGRTLFFNPRLSGSGWISCATCHNPGLSWGDGLPRAIGHGMKTLGRRTPTSLNLAWGQAFFWDGRADTLEAQALGPIQAAGEMNLDLPTMIEQNRINAEAAQASSEAIAQSSRWWVLSMMVGVLLVGGALAWIVIAGVNRLLGRVASDIAGSAEMLVSAAGDASRASDALSRSAGEQASSLAAASRSMAQISTTTRTNATHAHDAAALVTEADALIQSSNVALDAMVTSMAGIEDASSRVTRIIRTIDEIAFQTNILALNAAVEAARAGEAGAGFAVVAEEVRRLAQRSAQAARDTATLIEESSDRAREGTTRLKHVSSAVAAFTRQMSGVQDLVQTIRTSSDQQMSGIDQVSRTVEGMTRTTQAAAESAEASATAGDRLSTQAEAARTQSRQLDALVRGHRARTSRKAGGRAAPPSATPASPETTGVAA